MCVYIYAVLGIVIVCVGARVNLPLPKHKALPLSLIRSIISSSTHTQQRQGHHHHVGGGRNSQRFSTASGKEGADAKQLRWGLEVKGWNAIIALTASIGLTWEITYRFHQTEVARIMGEAEAKRRLDEVEAKRRLDKVEVEAKRCQDKVEAEAMRHQDKQELYKYFLQVIGTQDYEPLQGMLGKRGNGAATPADGEAKEEKKGE